MYSPVISRAGGGIGIPELGLEKLAAGIIEAAEIRNDGGVGAAEGEVEAIFGVAC